MLTETVVTEAKKGAPAGILPFANSDVLGRIGQLEVRIARSETELRAAFAVRARVFAAEFNAKLATRAVDQDAHDRFCDHLIVVDTSRKDERIVGTYRVLTSERARAAGGFYSASEFAVAGLIQRQPDRGFLELGRSCVLPAYRTKRTIELLWQGVWAYCLLSGADVMMGCASFPGTIPAAHAQGLSLLHHHARAEGDWSVSALAGRHCEMDLMPKEAIEIRTALSQLPPLIKGYLRLGARFGSGAVIDHEFNSTDVFVILPVENIAGRYRNYYGEDAGRFAA